MTDQTTENQSKKITNKAFIQTKSKINEASHIDNDIYKVVSGTSGSEYIVAIRPMNIDGEIKNGATCTCKWGQYRKWIDPRSGCSHVVAAFKEKLENESRRTASVWTNEESARRQKKQMVDIGDGVILTTRKN